MQLRNKKKHLHYLNEDVFCNTDFKRHIEETALKLNLPIGVVEFVVKNYLTTVVTYLYKFPFIMKRIVMPNYMNLFIKPKKK